MQHKLFSLPYCVTYNLSLPFLYSTLLDFNNQRLTVVINKGWYHFEFVPTWWFQTVLKVSLMSKQCRQKINSCLSNNTNPVSFRNPNHPVTLPSGTPQWPQFDTSTNKFMELNSANVHVITTPHKDRLDKLANTLLRARNVQVNADKGEYWSTCLSVCIHAYVLLSMCECFVCYHHLMLILT